MQDFLTTEELTGGQNPHPVYPRMISLDLTRALRDLLKYTNNLRSLAAPAELCIQKALELVNDRDNYDINVEAFRMDLVSEVLEESGIGDVNALISGIRCICEYLMETVDHHTGGVVRFFPYEFYGLHKQVHLFMTIITHDDQIPVFRPSTIAIPAYSYPEVQNSIRTDYSTQANQCLVF